MIDSKIADLLNRQITAEFHASLVYLQMGAWCEDKGLPGAAAFFMSHVPEEIAHRDQIVQYMFDCDASVKLGATEAPRAEFGNLLEVINAAYAHEQHVTSLINEIASAAMELSDFNTFTFIQAFINEQREEEALFRGVLDQASLSGFTGEPGEAMRHMNTYLGTLAKVPAASPEQPV